jgi:SAM-dependent methyltransferase
MSGSNTEQRLAWEQGIGVAWLKRADGMDRRLAPVGALLLERAAPTPGERVLDVGCGTGALATRLAEAVGVRGGVVGLDISETMLDAARRGGVPPSVELLRADAQSHVFPPPAFDLVVSRFGVMFFEDPVLAFRNLRRAMRPGARLCFAAWAPLTENPHWQIPLAAVIRRLGPPEPADPRAPGLLAFSDEGYVRGILAAAGFHGVAVARERVALLGGSAEEEAEHSLAMGPAARLMEERASAAEVREAILREVANAFRAYERDGACALPGTVLIVIAGA